MGKRLKQGIETPPLKILLSKPYAENIWKAVEKTKEGQRVFPYCSKTAYNIVSRVLKYPHYERLNRITNFVKEKRSIAKMRSWTGLSLQTLNFYVGARGGTSFMSVPNRICPPCRIGFFTRNCTGKTYIRLLSDKTLKFEATEN